jgi:hypothetical protein
MEYFLEEHVDIVINENSNGLSPKTKIVHDIDLIMGMILWSSCV